MRWRNREANETVCGKEFVSSEDSKRLLLKQKYQVDGMYMMYLLTKRRSYRLFQLHAICHWLCIHRIMPDH